jgi:hypothetical protein
VLLHGEDETKAGRRGFRETDTEAGALEGAEAAEAGGESGAGAGGSGKMEGEGEHWEDFLT